MDKSIGRYFCIGRPCCCSARRLPRCRCACGQFKASERPRILILIALGSIRLTGLAQQLNTLCGNVNFFPMPSPVVCRYERRVGWHLWALYDIGWIHLSFSTAAGGLGDVYVETIEASALATVKSRTSALLGDWKMPGEGLSLKGRNLESLNGIRRSRSEGLLEIFDFLAPQVGLEPTTLRLTAIQVVSLRPATY